MSLHREQARDNPRPDVGADFQPFSTLPGPTENLEVRGVMTVCTALASCPDVTRPWEYGRTVTWGWLNHTLSRRACLSKQTL